MLYNWPFAKSLSDHRTDRPRMFISLDGVDGSGKSTQHRLLCEWLTQQGFDVVACRDPGSTVVGDALRDLILQQHKVSIAARTEMLLYMASRAQLVAEVIRPALDAGRAVVSDRFLLANVVYQGHALGLDVEMLWEVGRIATAGVMPDRTIVLDLPPDKAATRMNRELDRVEQRGQAFQQKVRDGFLAEAGANKERISVVDASGEIDEIQDAIQAVVRTMPEFLRK